MSAFSSYLADKVLNHVLRGQVFTPPSGLYIALFTTDPTPGSTGTEVSTVGTGYTRQSISFSVALDQEIKNSNDIEFSGATSPWGTVTHVGIYDQDAAGNLLYYGELENPRAIFEGDLLRFSTDDLVISIQ